MRTKPEPSKNDVAASEITNKTDIKTRNAVTEKSKKTTINKIAAGQNGQNNTKEEKPVRNSQINTTESNEVTASKPYEERAPITVKPTTIDHEPT